MKLLEKLFNLIGINNDEQIEKNIEIYKNEFQNVLENLELQLRKSKNFAQANYLSELIEILSRNDFYEFRKKINTVNMWGGSGAVWEVYIEKQELRYSFNKTMLALITLMEKTRLAKGYTKSLKKIFI